MFQLLLMVDYHTLVDSMRNSNKGKENTLLLCKSENDILKKSILCKYYLLPSQYGCILENSIKEKFNIKKCNNTVSGDGIINKKAIEIKVSLGSKNGQYNFVQLRPGHKIDYYLFMCYSLISSSLGEIVWFLCEPNELYKLLPKYGEYSHGTIAKLGKITLENIDNDYEYSLRPNPNGRKKSRDLWNIMMSSFKMTDKEVYERLHQ